MEKFKTIADCPASVASLTPEAQTKRMEIANASMASGDGEGFACSRAWEAIRDNWTKNDDGSWQKTIPASTYATYDLSDPTHKMEGVEIFAAGEWKGDDFTPADLDEMVKAFNAKVVKTVPFKVGHDKTQKVAGQPNIGILDRVYRQGEKLFADISNIPKLVADLINKKAYTAVSAEIAFGAQFGKKIYDHLLTGVALLGAEIPAVNSLATLPAVYNFSDVRIYELPLDKKSGGVDNAVKTGGDTKMDLEKALAKIAELEGKVSELSATLTTEKARAEKAEGELQTVSKAADEAGVESFVAKLITDKKIVPAMKNQVKQTLLAADNAEKKEYAMGDKKVTETARETLMKVYESAGKLAIFGQASEAGDLKPAGDKAVEKANAYADEHKVSFKDALVKVYELHPELKTAAPVMGAPAKV